MFTQQDFCANMVDYLDQFRFSVRFIPLLQISMELPLDLLKRTTQIKRFVKHCLHSKINICLPLFMYFYASLSSSFLIDWFEWTADIFWNNKKKRRYFLIVLREINKNSFLRYFYKFEILCNFWALHQRHVWRFALRCLPLRSLLDSFLKNWY